MRAFIRQVGGDAVQERALLAAMPPRRLYHTSHWLEAGVERVRRVAECTVMEAIDLVERLQRWAHRAGRLPQLDAAIQVANLEMMRRREGAEPRAVELPGPTRPGDLSPLQVSGVVAQWEAWSYGIGLSDGDESELEGLSRVCAALTLILHLAFTDGLPARLERLDPEAFARSLDAKEREDPDAPPGFTANTLRWSCDFYRRLAERQILRPPVALPIAEELGVLSMVYSGSANAA